MLTPEENNVGQMAGDLMMAFAKLPQMHPADMEDVEFHVHAIQNIIMARSAQRTMPEQFPIYANRPPDVYTPTDQPWCGGDGKCEKQCGGCARL